MSWLTDEEIEETVRRLLGLESDPLCPRCSQTLQWTFDYEDPSGRLGLRVTCSDCGDGFEWRQGPKKKWQVIHLNYFMERYLSEDLIRCPVDDCLVVSAEFSDRTIEFRCPFCNRRGQRQKPSRKLVELELR